MYIQRFRVNMMKENTYVVYDDTKECVIIDCGCYGQQELYQLSLFIEGHGLKPTHLLCTHFHLDHTFGNGFVWYRYGLRAEANEADHLLSDMIHYQFVAFGLNDGSVEIPNPIYSLKDGSIVKFGNTEFHVIATPGHSPGGVCFYCPKENILFSGDTLMKGAVGATNLPGARKSKLLKSVTEILFALPDETKVYAGHGDPTTIGEEKVCNPIVHEVAMRVEKGEKM